jgi:DNA-binding NtrC family response regulator
MEGRLLLVDADEATCELLAATLRGQEFDAQWATSGEQALQCLEHESFDALVADFEMTGMNGLDVCRRALAHQPTLPIIVVTGPANLEAAVSAMRAGAYHFLTKPVDAQLLAHQVHRAVEHGRLAREVLELRSRLLTEQEELISLDEVEARYIRKVLHAVDGNKSRAARILGLDRRSLYRRLEKYEL